MEELKEKILEILKSYEESFLSEFGEVKLHTIGIDSEHFPYIAKEIIDEIKKT